MGNKWCPPVSGFSVLASTACVSRFEASVRLHRSATSRILKTSSAALVTVVSKTVQLQSRINLPSLGDRARLGQNLFPLHWTVATVNSASLGDRRARALSLRISRMPPSRAGGGALRCPSRAGAHRSGSSATAPACHDSASRGGRPARECMRESALLGARRSPLAVG